MQDRSSRFTVSVLAVVALVIGLAGCGMPVPEEKQLYVGQWDSPGMSLRIDADGTVAYERSRGGGNVTIDAPIQEFQGDDFVVGVAMLNTTFEVSRPPWHEDGRWWMVVDGVELVRDEQVPASRSAEVGRIGVDIRDLGVFGRERRDGSRPIIESTSRIRGVVGQGFGVKFTLDAPEGGETMLTYRWDSPPLRDPATGQVRDSHVLHQATAAGELHWVSYDLGEPWEIVPGEWTLTILQGNRTLARESFQIYLPGA